MVKHKKLPKKGKKSLTPQKIPVFYLTLSRDREKGSIFPLSYK